MVGLCAVIAHHERETISLSTKNALTAKKASAQLFTPANLTETVIRQGWQVQQQNAREHQANRQTARLGKLLQEQGHTLQQIDQELNEAGYRT